MNLQDVLAMHQTPAIQKLIAPNPAFDFPVTLTEDELNQSLKKADQKTARLLSGVTWPPVNQQQQQLVIDLVSINREIEIAETKYRKTADATDIKSVDEHTALTNLIPLLQQHKSTLSQQLLN